MFFSSDNTAPVAPEVMQAIADANDSFSWSYGADAFTKRAVDAVRTVFEAPEAAVYLVPTGTAANALALALLAQPWQTVFCHRLAHINANECGAPEFFTGGAKLVPVEGPHGRIDPTEFRSMAAQINPKDVQHVQAGALSLTTVTEAGTVYSVDEIAELCALAREFGFATHLDGARFANALVALDCTPADMTWKAGIDVVSFGGTKNGLMAAEAVVIFDPEKAWEFELRRKRGGHLLSKHRHMAAQMEAYLADGLWQRLARQANDAAARLEAGLSAIEGCHLHHPREANILFCDLPRDGYDRAIAGGAMVYTEGDGDAEVQPCRLVTNWATTEGEIAQFLGFIQG